MAGGRGGGGGRGGQGEVYYSATETICRRRSAAACGRGSRVVQCQSVSFDTHHTKKDSGCCSGTTGRSGERL